MKYCTDFICTYKDIDNDLSDDLYKAQFLQAFHLNNWNYKKIKIIIQDVYDLIYPELKYIIDFIKQSNNKHFSIIKMFLQENDDDIAVFEILFAYDYFDLLHKCICEKINNNTISEQSLNNLLNKIKSG